MLRILVKLALFMVVAAGCATQNTDEGGLDRSVNQESEMAVLVLPDLEVAETGNGKLRTAATTSIIGDIVSNVGGEYIDLVVLMAAGQDPHSFELSPGDLASIVDVQVIFVNGWNLEEGLISDLAAAAEEAVLVPVSAGIIPLPAGIDNHNKDLAAAQAKELESGPDPHTWLDPRQVVTWVDNIESVLSELDPSHSTEYQTNAESYVQELKSLIDYIDVKVSSIPLDKRTLVTGHDSLAYLAAAYDFDIVGTLIPSASTLAEPSSSELARLIEVMEEQGVCTIFIDTTANNQLARTAAEELDFCDEVRVIDLYTGALGPPGSGADEYLNMMRANIDAIVAGLKE